MSAIRYGVASSLLLARPAVAAVPETGIGDPGPAFVLFAAAAVLIVALLSRSALGPAIVAARRRANHFRTRRELESRSSNVLHDFILPGAYGGLTKIDHAMLTAGGILCIRGVHCNGIILGADSDPQWTFVNGRTRNRFLNPVIQNAGRARALQAVVPDVPVANLVIFTGDVEFPTPPPKNVILLRNLDSFIAKFVFGPAKVKDWDAVWLTLRSSAMTDAAARRDFQAQLGFS